MSPPLRGGGGVVVAVRSPRTLGSAGGKGWTRPLVSVPPGGGRGEEGGRTGRRGVEPVNPGTVDLGDCLTKTVNERQKVIPASSPPRPFPPPPLP